MPSVTKYWVYVHDENGNHVEDLYDGNDYVDAIAASGVALSNQYWNVNHSIHIVDQENDSNSVWIAGACTVKGEA